VADNRKRKLKPEQGAVRKGKQGSYAVPKDLEEPEANVESEPRGRDKFSGEETS
jgi:hypothetical protein